MSHIAIYTVITGDYDELNQPQVVVPGADCFLFTNNQNLIRKCDSEGCIGVWKVMLLNEDSVNNNGVATNRETYNILLSRKVKMLPHLYLDHKYDMSIYLDADMLITGDLTELTNWLTVDTTMAAFRHSYCHSVREEIDDLIRRGVVEKDMAENQWLRYVEWGFKDNLGITENGILIRRHNDPQVIRLMQLWWQEFQNGCLRDQISLMPCLYRLGFEKFMILDANIHNNKWVMICSHKK